MGDAGRGSGWTADRVAELDLAPHPEGGWYRRTWTADEVVDPATGRRAASAIWYLLGAGEQGRWHRVVDAEERWELVEGGPLALTWTLGDAVHGHRLALGGVVRAVVPAGAWQQAATPTGAALCRCTVTPEFRFEAFELAPEGWRPPSHHTA